MEREINPKLKMLAKLTYEPDLDLSNVDRIIEHTEPESVPELEGYIYIPSIKLYVAKEKSLYGKNWFETHTELNKLGLQMLTIRQFIEFIVYLQKNKDAIAEARQILDDILTVKRLWRAEWLDALFVRKGKKMYIHYNHRILNGSLKAQTKEPLEKCLMKDCSIDIHSANKQGLPKKLGNDLIYWCPRETSVARFYADPFRTFLSCFTNPDGKDSFSGTRVACKK